jgi:predicted dehydrogenase
MDRKLKVLVSGTGFASQGHTDAFRAADCDVVGIVGRTEHLVKEVAQKKGIHFSGMNWVQAIDECQPDIVAIGTPGGAHFETITQAINKGCHVFCDKPLMQRN